MVGEMRVMGQRGDTKIIWNTDNDDEVENARKNWKRLIEKSKFAAFRVKPDGEPGERVHKFDPTVGKLIIVPPMAGGDS